MEQRVGPLLSVGNLVVKNRRGIRSVAVLDDESLSTKNDSKRSAVIRVLRCLFFSLRFSSKFTPKAHKTEL